ncbi:hypothetical protein ACQUQU_09245 [Thalassolituus sp. LLYu03]|uniref:hypothetical protein n=1 Tax=Thalassolituus sp. LLYu03 TaxID=3421656 RepID=UPI003D2D5BB8
MHRTISVPGHIEQYAAFNRTDYLVMLVFLAVWFPGIQIIRHPIHKRRRLYPQRSGLPSLNDINRPEWLSLIAMLVTLAMLLARFVF